MAPNIKNVIAADAFGAVSVACVYAMAQGALERSKADVAADLTDEFEDLGDPRFDPFLLPIQ